MRTYVCAEVLLTAFAGLVCLGSLKLGFGRFSDPGAGFMPFLSAFLLGVLSLVDLASGVLSRWNADKKDGEIWSNIDWARLLSTLGMLLLYLLLLPVLGFSLPTILLLLILFRLIERRPWWFVALFSIVTTVMFYVGFEIILGAQLPKGILPF